MECPASPIRMAPSAARVGYLADIWLIPEKNKCQAKLFTVRSSRTGMLIMMHQSLHNVQYSTVLYFSTMYRGSVSCDV